MLEFYWGCLITGIIFTLLTVIFDDFLGNMMEGILDALTFDLPGFFNTTVLMSALTTLGGAGILFTLYTSLSHVVIFLLSLCSAFLLSTFFYFLYVKPMERAESSTGFSVKDFIGMVGEVTIPIPKEGYGEIVLSIAGASSNQIAASFDEEEIPSGSKALVIEVREGTLLVSPYEQI
ncbi:membrane protein implicated in regulation of membrane protease activity [Bacillus mesophilus]|uniref:Protease n=1 Tax=Bacillus mesophilus TaxID=1808955 RepID=A0A6M0Q2Z6_9BACI|nr:NfeD family protein [Bacillus mesophilus]MBM7659848.1 membrane protein implicated in regulation of membrane protease activity [Bacillus mesophilus]NEY70707.1 protease [Bacillus mesophilus]